MPFIIKRAQNSDTFESSLAGGKPVTAMTGAFGFERCAVGSCVGPDNVVYANLQGGGCADVMPHPIAIG